MGVSWDPGTDDPDPIGVTAGRMVINDDDRSPVGLLPRNPPLRPTTVHGPVGVTDTNDPFKLTAIKIPLPKAFGRVGSPVEVVDHRL